MNDKYEFRYLDEFGAEAIGVPGHRRFRMYAREEGKTASFWLEREHLEQLLLAFEQVQAQIAGEEMVRIDISEVSAAEPHAPAGFPEQTDIDVQVGQLALAYLEDEGKILVRITPILFVREEDEEILADQENIADIDLVATTSQVKEICKSIRYILSSGRPRCQLCGAPLDPGPHACPKQNGHVKISIES